MKYAINLELSKEESKLLEESLDSLVNTDIQFISQKQQVAIERILLRLVELNK